jgi:death on curing protein
VDDPLWLDRSIVEALHAAQIREHGGKPGIREVSLFESAPARPVNVWSYDESVDLAALGAEYGYGLAKNHAFLDGNKRIGFVAVNVFLLLNGFEIDASEPEAVHVMLSVADGSLGRDALAEWSRANIVRFTE